MTVCYYSNCSFIIIITNLKLKNPLYYDKSGANLYPHVAAWVLDMFWNFYLVKNHKIVNKFLM